MIKFNKAYANKVSKKQFIEEHSHYLTDEAHAGINLGEVWESLQEKKESTAEVAKEKAVPVKKD